MARGIAPPPPCDTDPLIKIDGPGTGYDAIEPSRTRPAWRHEARVVGVSAGPLVVTFLLQYSIDMMSLMAAGRVGKVQLGAVSLANMSAAITCFAPIQGLATSLDTLCAQAYGSGQKHLIGLHCQRLTLLLLTLLIPISLLWLNAIPLLARLIADTATAHLASQYLRILILAIPGYIVFEVGKRFLQAQGLFRATTAILVVAAPCHVVLVTQLVARFGFVGAPMAVALTRTWIAVLLVAYVALVDGRACWGGVSRRALKNWSSMVCLAVPGMVMVEAEYLAFEVLIVISSRFGVDYLAAQSILAALGTISFQVPFSISIAASTRIASLIGAGLVDSAKVAAKVAIAATCISGSLNLVIYTAFHALLPYIFTSDPAVAALTTRALPILSLLAFLEGLVTIAHGLLRGIGRQAIGGPATLAAYYLVALPCALALGVALDWRLHGLLLGLSLGLTVAILIELTYLALTDWRKTAIEAAARNAAG